MLAEILRGALAADAVVALKDDRRIGIELEQRIVTGLIEEARTGDAGDVALRGRAYVDELERRSAVDQRLQLRRRQLTDGR